jgi:enoyl-CoA hydratase/carnithine racemase
MAQHTRPLRDYAAKHFRWDTDSDGKVATITLDRPGKKNPLTFDSYAELRELFRALVHASDVKAVVIACPQPIVAAIDGVCAGAGAMVALASDVRFGTPAAKTAFLFVRVGLAGCDMGACTLLPRMIGQGRAAELLYTGRVMSADEGAAWGFFNRLVAGEALVAEARAFARALADGPTFAHAMTKKLLHQEWAMDLDAAIEAEAEAQAICMQTQDFRRAFDAFAAKRKPRFEGN